MIILDFPNLRQTGNYDCGAKALQSVLAYYGIAMKEELLMREVGTTSEGTPIQGIISVAERHGLQCDSRQMAFEDVKDFISNDIPVILVLQAWAKEPGKNWEANWDDGHYVVAIGYDRERIIFEDPSSFKRTYLTFEELEKRWHDIGADGKRYDRHGIAVHGKTPKFGSTKLVHMD